LGRNELGIGKLVASPPLPHRASSIHSEETARQILGSVAGLDDLMPMHICMAPIALQFRNQQLQHQVSSSQNRTERCKLGRVCAIINPLDIA
jgi:hypothetical protein